MTSNGKFEKVPIVDLQTRGKWTGLYEEMTADPKSAIVVTPHEAAQAAMSFKSNARWKDWRMRRKTVGEKCYVWAERR